MKKTPFLLGEIQHIETQCEQWKLDFLKTIQASFLSSESRYSAKACLVEIYKIQHFLANLTAVEFHPFYFYELLFKFYLQIRLYQEDNELDIKTQHYQHENLKQCLIQEVIIPLYQKLNQTPKPIQLKEFEKKEGLRLLFPLPPEVYQAKEIYILFQKKDADASLDLKDFKLSSKSRLSQLCQFSLPGISLEKATFPPAVSPFGTEVEIFQLLPGEEWDHALKEQSLAFNESAQIQDVKAFIYWK